MRIAVAVAVLAIALTACAQPAQAPSAKAPKTVTEVLWPKAQPAPAVVPPPKAAPKAIAKPKAPAKRKAAEPARQEKPPQVRAKKLTPAAADNGGPDLPWPCALIRMHAAGKSRAQLEAEGRTNGISLSPKQKRQAAACLR